MLWRWLLIALIFWIAFKTGNLSTVLKWGGIPLLIVCFLEAVGWNGSGLTARE
jgi:hypothetical protein